MNRRGFLGTLAAWAIAPFAMKNIPAVARRRIWRAPSIPPRCIYKTISTDGGYLVPREFEPVIKNLGVRGQSFLNPPVVTHATIVYDVTLLTVDGRIVRRSYPYRPDLASQAITHSSE